jgi:DNA (cytosine-5)-methyltransferase 1
MAPVIDQWRGMLTSLDLFAGAGGLALGMSLAGFRHRAVVEWNHDACETIRRNRAMGHPHVVDWPLHESDARALDYRSLAGTIDVVAGGPPCQPFSMGGRHKGHGDARDMFPTLIEAIGAVRPRAFLIENVKGLTRPAFADYFDHILTSLARPGAADPAGRGHGAHGRKAGLAGGDRDLRYDVSFRVLNAADHGVPQIRERVFIVGLRRDLGAQWAFPAPTHTRPTPRGTRVEGRLPWVTVREALAGLPDPERTPEAAADIPNHRHQPGVRFYPGHTGSRLDRPAKTLKAGDHGVPGGENALVRPDGGGRYFTVREAARLQTFPDSYVFSGSWSEAMRQIGNAVPVRLAHVVATELARVLRAAAPDPRRDATAQGAFAVTASPSTWAS